MIIPGSEFNRTLLSKGTITKEGARRLNLRKKFPFPIKVIEIDGCSEFKAKLEEACLMKQILLFELPPELF